jgi:GTP-binding protein
MKLNTQNVSLRISAGRADQFPRDAIPQIALSGRSNVGKSSLINALLNRKAMARVSSSPGKTITVNFYDIDKKLFLVDLPGYGFAKRPAADRDIWAALTDGYFTNNPNLDLIKLVVQLIDSRIGPTKDDMDMIEWLSRAQMPYIIVATKVDKLSKTELAKSVASISEFAGPECRVIPFSAEKKIGVQELWNSILEYCQ